MLQVLTLKVEFLLTDNVNLMIIIMRWEDRIEDIYRHRRILGINNCHQLSRVDFVYWKRQRMGNELLQLFNKKTGD